MMRGIVVGVVALCVLSAYLRSKRASRRVAQQNADLRRWEDDGGHLPEVDHHDAPRPAVTVDSHST